MSKRPRNEADGHDEGELPAGLTLRALPRTDVPRAAQLEASSYPPDEAASPATLDFRCERAPAFFRALYDERRGGELVGFVVGTCSTAVHGRLEHASMSSHDESGKGPLTLMVHSVVVAEARRRRGLGRAMLREYLRQLATSSAAPACRVSRVLLISKLPNLPLYLACGFSLVGRSTVAHGRDSWYELELDLAELRHDLREDGPRAEAMVQVDAFSRAPFAGNPAAVVFTQRGGAAAWMLAVAAENALPETAFVAPLWEVEEAKEERDEAGGAGGAGAPPRAARGVVARDGCAHFGLRWFTPTVEVSLCGHATIAAAHALWESGQAPAGAPIEFHTRMAGALRATQLADGFIRIELRAPVLESPDVALAAACADPAAEVHTLLCALGLGAGARARGVGEAFVGPPEARDLLVLLSRDEFEQLGDTPDLRAISDATTRLGLRAVVPVVEGDGCAGGARARASRLYAALAARRALPARIDFTSRFFAPAIGIDEDPVTGSAHALLAVFWTAGAGARGAGAQLLGYQASARGGLVRVRVVDGLVHVEGEATTVIRAQLLA